MSGNISDRSISAADGESYHYQSNNKGLTAESGCSLVKIVGIFTSAATNIATPAMAAIQQAQASAATRGTASNSTTGNSTNNSITNNNSSSTTANTGSVHAGNSASSGTESKLVLSWKSFTANMDIGVGDKGSTTSTSTVAEPWNAMGYMSGLWKNSSQLNMGNYALLLGLFHFDLSHNIFQLFHRIYTESRWGIYELNRGRKQGSVERVKRCIF